ncbi:MAG: hypothetical protein ACI9OJ_001816 [Myxococcota bacterium]|jgi:hypothetical protein
MRIPLIVMSILLVGCPTDGDSGAVTDVGSVTADTVETADVPNSASDIIEDSGALVDIAVDAEELDTAMPTDTPDTVGDMAQHDSSDTTISCPPDDPLDSFAFAVNITPSEGGESSAVGLGLVTKAEPYCCDADWDWEVTVQLGETTVNIRAKLPESTDPPAVVGEMVHVRASVQYGFPTVVSAFITDVDGTLRYLQYEGVSPAKTDCEAGPCYQLIQLAAHCPPIAAECGNTVFPPVSISVPPASPVTLAQGESQTTAGDTHWWLARSEATSDLTCRDYPNNFVQVVAIAPQAGCDESKLGLSMANPESFELYALCTTDTGAVTTVDPSLNCPGGSVFVKCADGETACMGQLDYEPNDSKVISPNKFGQLCGLSNLPAVSQIAGGHYLN